MTETQIRWRLKRINKIRVINKIHNLVLGVFTGLMTVFFLMTLCAELNKDSILIFILSSIYLSIFSYANDF